MVKGMTVALRLKASGVLAMIVAGLLLGCAAATGLLPAAPPTFLAPAAAVLIGALTVVKFAAVATALVRCALTRD